MAQNSINLFSFQTHSLSYLPHLLRARSEFGSIFLPYRLKSASVFDLYTNKFIIGPYRFMITNK